MSGLNNIRLSSSKPKTWLIANELSKICQISDTFWISKISKSLMFWKKSKNKIKWIRFQSDWNSRELNWKIDKLNYVCKYSGCGIRKGIKPMRFEYKNTKSDRNRSKCSCEYWITGFKSLSIFMSRRNPWAILIILEEDIHETGMSVGSNKNVYDCGKNHIESDLWESDVYLPSKTK